MAKITILVEGYAQEIENGWRASSTAVLVESNGKKVVVDPGCDREKLLAGLAKHNLKPADIDFVLLTHSHLDHALLAGIFENAQALTADEIYNRSHQIEHNNLIPGTDLKIIQTPGHFPEHCSLAVPTGDGTCIVAGDAFWWTDAEDQIVDINKADQAHPKEANQEQLKASRQTILSQATQIIPGHGRIFKGNDSKN